MTNLLITVYSFAWLADVPLSAWIFAGVAAWLAVAVLVSLRVGRVLGAIAATPLPRQEPHQRAGREPDEWFDGYVRGHLDDNELDDNDTPRKELH